MFKIKFAAMTVFLVGLLSLSALAQDGSTTQVKFARGKSSAVYTGRISRTEGVRHYEFRAKAGQTVSVSVSAPGNNVKFMFFAAGSGSQINDKERNWSFRLDEEGDYVVTVQSTKGAANYRLNIAIR